jgi:hypothetical protein
MDVRPELLPPGVGPERLAELARRIEEISDLVLRGEPAAEAIAAFNEMTGHDYDSADFAEYHGWRALEDFAREAARPPRPRIPDITRDELVDIVRRLQAADPDTGYYLRLLKANVAHPRVADLIYHPPAELGRASAEQIVDTALSYRPITL